MTIPVLCSSNCCVCSPPSFQQRWGYDYPHIWCALPGFQIHIWQPTTPVPWGIPAGMSCAFCRYSTPSLMSYCHIGLWCTADAAVFPTHLLLQQLSVNPGHWCSASCWLHLRESVHGNIPSGYGTMPHNLANRCLLSQPREPFQSHDKFDRWQHIVKESRPAAMVMSMYSWPFHLIPRKFKSPKSINKYLLVRPLVITLHESTVCTLYPNQFGQHIHRRMAKIDFFTTITVFFLFFFYRITDRVYRRNTKVH